MPRTQRPSPYRHAEFILQNYWNYKRELERRIEDYALTTPVYDNTPVQQGRKADPTANAGIKLASDNYVSFLRSAVKAVDETLFEFADLFNGAAIVMLIKLIYWDGQSLENAADKVNYSYVHSQRLREDFINELVLRLGWSDEKRYS